MNKHYALITGASSGIGKEFARLFAEDGVSVILVARSKPELIAYAKELRKFDVDVVVRAVDLSEPAARKRFIKNTLKNYQIRFLVNSAGFGDYRTFAKADLPTLQAMIDLNISALTELCHEFAPRMARTKGAHIVNLASTASFFPGAGMAVYYATKAYVLSLSEALAEEYGAKLAVTALCPGPTESGFQQAAKLKNSKLVKDKKLPTSAHVARFGYQAMLAGKRVAIPGISNKLNVFVARFLPRRYIAQFVARAQSEAS